LVDFIRVQKNAILVGFASARLACLRDSLATYVTGL
jgi:hypothetical protein